MLTSVHAEAVGSSAERSSASDLSNQRDAWERTGAEWEACAPRGPYARWFRSPFLYACALSMVLPALCVALPIILVNLMLFRDPRLVFFRQERVGYRGRRYLVVKFRTMRGASTRAGDMRGDRLRVTRFGRLLRNTHLDELPQLWNVLVGDMCLIGPRPEMVDLERWASEAIPGFSERLVVKPGITGLAQITLGYAVGHDVEAYRNKLDTNRRYLAELSFTRDVTILVGTAAWMVRGRGWKPTA